MHNMNQKNSINDWELYHKIKGETSPIVKEIKPQKKPYIGVLWGKFCIFGQKLIKKPIFSTLFSMNVILLVSYFNCILNGEHIDLFKWVTTTSFLVFFGYLTFFDKN
jgi:hypothetical protein